MPSLIHIENLTLVKGQGVTRRVILDNISLSIEKNTITTIIGPNGAGKTTLLRVILGLETAYQGQCTTTAGCRIGYTPQQLVINPLLPLTVENFLWLSSKQAVSKRHARTHIQDILAEVGAAHLLKESLHTLSGGQKQRVLLAQALLDSPQLLVLDEPTQGVDVLGLEELYRLIQRIQKERSCSVLLVSHDLHYVMSASDLVICLNKHICCSGHPSNIQNHPQYQQLFYDHLRNQNTIKGATPLAVALYQHEHDHRHDILKKDTATSKCCQKHDSQDSGDIPDDY